MKCPQCVSEGLRSQVTMGSPFKTEKGKPVQFWDEDGNYHYHDPAKYSTDYRCSNGHEFNLASTHGCPTCGESWRPENAGTDRGKPDQSNKPPKPDNSEGDEGDGKKKINHIKG